MSAIPKPALTIEFSLLGFLAEKPMHGYEIHLRLSEAAGLGTVWHIKQSHLYTILARLENQGFITYVLEPQEARPPRKVYSLTPDGEDAIRCWISSPVDRGRDFRMEFLAKVYFAHRQGTESLRALLDAQRTMCHAWETDLQALLDRQGLDAYGGLVYRYRLSQVTAMLGWLDESEAILSVGPAQ